MKHLCTKPRNLVFKQGEKSQRGPGCKGGKLSLPAVVGWQGIPLWGHYKGPREKDRTQWPMECEVRVWHGSRETPAHSLVTLTNLSTSLRNWDFQGELWTILPICIGFGQGTVSWILLFHHLLLPGQPSGPGLQVPFSRPDPYQPAPPWGALRASCQPRASKSF